MRRAKQHVSPSRQRGVMNLLLVLLVGLAMTVTTMGVVHTVRSSQEGQLSLHSITPAQGSTWMDAEVVRRYLAAANMATLKSGPLQVSGDDMTVTILNIKPTSSSSGTSGTTYQVVANITAGAATGTPAASKATLQVVYNVTPNATKGTGSNNSNGNASVNVDTLNFYKDLNLTGGITVLGGAQNANLNVQGNVTLDNATITGVNSIRSTGNVTVGSGIHVNQIYANGDVTVTGAASADLINALGNVTIDGGANPFVIQANGSVTFNGGNATSVTAIGDVNVPAGGVKIGTITTQGNVDWTGSGGSVSTIQANGNVIYDGGNNQTSITAGGNVTLNGAGVATVTTPGNVFDNVNDGESTTIKAGGDLTLNSWQPGSATIGGKFNNVLNRSSGFTVTQQSGYVVTVPTITITPLPPVTISQPGIDAYALQSLANYQFQFVQGAIQVTVSNVANIPNGTYYLGWYPGSSLNGAPWRGYEDFLCTKLVPNSVNNGIGQCLEPVTPAHTICQGQSEENNCFSYNNGVWTLSGKSLARGILWFQGDLDFNGGYYLDTAIATGNINTAGAFRIDAPNYAGYDEMCANVTPAGLTLDATQQADFAGMYPTNLCDTANKQLFDNSIGNVALLAGGYVDGTFSGGDINVGASSVINGSVMAGNVLNTGGSTTINGSITAAAQNPNDNTPNNISGATLMNMNQLPGTYKPGTVPCMQSCTSATAGSNGSNTSTITWTRYL
ncbi:hypothetical protein [Dyella nitratireducens]|uniref:Uncharacterized protein n=1 Tax=Dyella nitratireducens TaxID=1849580 RepID=A0ABQ1GI19_9GAMM|nr:hypothetical protein [Dyella nitratireducens]GGA44086.1 hypothetical protein GCM10010981_36540 [Dyella nitratireducens]GLQ41789.1 hypothetical protein GCM10007902_16390 [Dyella nitratireducens]